MKEEELLEFDCGDTVIIADSWSTFQVKGLFLHNNSSSIFFVDLKDLKVAPVKDVSFKFARNICVHTTRIVLVEKFSLKHYHNAVPHSKIFIDKINSERMENRKQLNKKVNV